MENFTVKHYADTAHPVIKGNGFDGLVVGEYRDEAQDFVDFVNKATKNNLTQEDVATIEFLHDRLLEVYKENINTDFLIRARDLAVKINNLI